MTTETEKTGTSNLKAEPSFSESLKIKFKSKLLPLSREIIAPLVWFYFIIKLFVFDFDSYLINNFVPIFGWVLDYKLFILLGGTALVWLILGNKEFFKLTAYIFGYPLIILFWKIPKFAFRNWPIVLAFSPAIHEAIVTLRSKFISYTVGIISCLFISLSTNRYILTVSLSTLMFFLITHLYTSFRRAYKASFFSDLSNLITQFREKITDDSLRDSFWKNVEPDPASPERDKAFQDHISLIYTINWGVEFSGDKLRQVVKGRTIDLYFILSLIWTAVITCLVYSFEYWSIFKIDRRSFSYSFEPGFWSFLGFSFDKLTPSSISTIRPENLNAIILCYSEYFCFLIVAVILLFTILTAARERYREDMEDFIRELQLTSDVIQTKCLSIYKMALVDVEKLLIRNNLSMINTFRKWRGQTELSAPTNDGKPPDKI